MKPFTSILLFVFSLASIHWVTWKKESRVIYYRCDAGDDVFTHLGVSVYENKQGKLVSLSGVKFSIQPTNITVYTDSIGDLFTSFEKGSFSFMVFKDGYEPLHITNFIASPDDVCRLNIVLEKGHVLRTCKLSEEQGH